MNGLAQCGQPPVKPPAVRQPLLQVTSLGVSNATPWQPRDAGVAGSALTRGAGSAFVAVGYYGEVGRASPRACRSSSGAWTRSPSRVSLASGGRQPPLSRSGVCRPMLRLPRRPGLLEFPKQLEEIGSILLLRRGGRSSANLLTLCHLLPLFLPSHRCPVEIAEGEAVRFGAVED